MTYSLKTSPSVDKFFKKTLKKDKPLKEKFKEAFQDIMADPIEAGTPKTGDLSGVYTYDFIYVRTQYRIAYSVERDENDDIVVVILAGTHEQFYKELKRYIKSSNFTNG